jgi:GR25 family glycosyltransferase involved in LPS biosynthesis
MALTEMGFFSKGCYKMFHLAVDDSDVKRKACFKKVNTLLGSKLQESWTPTVSIKTLDELKAFMFEYPMVNIDGNGFDIAQAGMKKYNKEIANPTGWYLSEIGIMASHYVAWKNFLNTEYEYMLLFEDDVYVADNFLELFAERYKELPSDWEAFYFCTPEVKFDVRFVNGTDRSISENLCEPYHYWSSAGYAVSKSGAAQLVDYVENKYSIHLPLDWFILQKNAIEKVYSIKPNRDQGCRLVNTESTYLSKENKYDLTKFIAKVKSEIL